jgi:hypothetical protein
VESFEEEDIVIATAVDDAGEVVDSEVAKKLFSISAQKTDKAVITKEQKEKLEELESGLVGLTSQRIAERNSDFFDNEVDKLDKWAEDMKKALELDLKKLDVDIKISKTNAKKILNLDEKLKAQRGIKDMEKKRNEMRKKLYEAQDIVEGRKEKLIEQVESQLKQKSKLESLFTIRWRVV